MKVNEEPRADHRESEKEIEAGRPVSPAQRGAALFDSLSDFFQNWSLVSQLLDVEPGGGSALRPDSFARPLTVLRFQDCSLQLFSFLCRY